MIKFSLEWR